MAVSREELERIFSERLKTLDASKLQGVDATIQFDLSGENGGVFWLRIADSAVDVGEGQVESPTMTLRALADDFAAMVSGALNPMQGFMSGRIKIQGDTNLAMKLMPLINA